MAEADGNSDNLNTIKEQILDEQKIVTYITLSKNLCIHVNEAKTLLSQVVDEIKRNSPQNKLNLCYIISGLSRDHTGRTTVCSEADLEAQKKDFKSVFFQHIYSVSQGSSYADNATFVSINKFEDFPLCAGLIKSNSCSKRSSDEIGNLKSNSQVVINEQKTAVLPKEIKEQNQNVLKNGSKDIVKIHETKSELTKSEVTSPKKITSTSNEKASTKNGVKTTKGIAGFFTKSNSAPHIKSSKVIKEPVQETINTEIQSKEETKSELKRDAVKKASIPEIKVEESMDVDEEVPIKKIKKEPESTKKINNKKQITKNSSLNQIKKNAKVDKKRKRVLHVSDSESDNDPFEDENLADPESDDEIPPTPSTNTVKITSGILNPKKKRKIVDKTYTDEEGYILTRKEEVYESCSEEEDIIKSEPVQVKVEKENVEHLNKVKMEVSPKDKKGKNNKKKVSPPQKGKKVTMMNFFKKI